MKTIKIISNVVLVAILLFTVVAPLFQTRDFANVEQTTGVSQGFYAQNNAVNYIVVDDEKYFFEAGSPVSASELYAVLAKEANVEFSYIADSHIIVALAVDGNGIFTAEQYKQNFNQWKVTPPPSEICAFVQLLCYWQFLPKKLFNTSTIKLIFRYTYVIMYQIGGTICKRITKFQ